MKTKKVVIHFVGVSMTMAVTVQTKGQAEIPATPSVPERKKVLRELTLIGAN